MKICNKAQEIKKFKIGNLYKVKEPIHSKAGEVCIYTSIGKMVRLSDGLGTIVHADPTLWEDVTDKYCLSEI